jgi:hypothetical protein
VGLYHSPDNTLEKFVVKRFNYYDELFEEQKLLRALKAAGVDNLDGFALEVVYGKD